MALHSSGGLGPLIRPDLRYAARVNAVAVVESTLAGLLSAESFEEGAGLLLEVVGKRPGNTGPPGAACSTPRAAR